MKGMVLFWCIVAAVGIVSAEVPEYYSVLSRNVPEYNELIYDGAPSGESSWRPSSEDMANGFGYSVEGVSTMPSGNFIWKTPSPRHAIRLFMGREEARSVLFAIRGLKDGVTLSLKAECLHNGNDSLAESCVLFQKIHHVAQPKHGQPTRYLVPVDKITLHKDKTLFVLCTFIAPKEAKAGVYHGEIRLEKASVPVALRVLDGTVTPDVKFGLYLPGSFYEPTRSDDSKFRNYVSRHFTPENLEKWVVFNKSRCINSPFPYHLLIETKLEKGVVTAAIPFLDTLLPLLKKHQPDAVVPIDLRFLEWWAASVERELRGKGITDWRSATSALTYQQGDWPDKNTGDMARELVEAGCRAIKERYEPFGIRLLFMPEEEIAYPTIKTSMYDTFIQAVINGAGRENVCLVDNGVGSDNNCIDRGDRDKLPFREYNGWCQRFLDSASAQNAEVWLYNNGWNRAFPYFMMRIGAKGYHQWADQWYDPTMDWTASLPQPDGCLSTLPLEVCVEGIRDLGYFQLLDKYGLAELRRRHFDILPCDRSVVAEICGKSDEELDAVRWEVVMAVSREQIRRGERPLWSDGNAVLEGKASVAVFPSTATGANGASACRGVRKVDGLIRVDGAFATEEWRGCKYEGPFQKTLAEQQRLRALASSEEEFKQKAQASGCSFRVAYDGRGLFFAVDANHLKVGMRASHGDDDTEIWDDDVFEFFWKDELDGREWHLLVNTLGKSVLLCNGQLRKHTGVQAAQRDRDNGMLQEIMVPWSAIGRREPPPDGSVWGFNVCRAFWSWKQLSSWSPVFDHFVMGDGRLEFGGFADEGNGKVDVSPKTLLPGMNRLSVTLPPEGVFSVALKWADGSVISRNDAATGKASLEVNLPQGKGGNAQLVVNQGDNMIADLTVPVLAKSDISFVSLTDTVIVGNIVRMVCMTRLPNLTIEREKLHVTILDGGQKPVFKAVAELMDGYSNVHISTDGLPAGRFTLVLSAGALDGGNDVSQARRALTLLRSPWAP